MTSATNGTNTLSFAYNADGLRTSKTVNGVVHNYYYADGKLVRETYGDTVLDFFYDASGYPYIMKMGNNIYYYITNAQGDVIRLTDIHGNTAAYYQYDPYGKVIHASGSHANINPLKYRAYLHDTETGFYYLQSRYYDPEVGRFTNADALVSTGQGLLGNNTFAYCNNNPVVLADPEGYGPWTPIKNFFDYYIIHKMVQADVCIKNDIRFQLEVYVKGDLGRGFLDIHDPSTNSYYEVKSIGQVELSKTSDQMKKYDASYIKDKRYNGLITEKPVRGTESFSGKFEYGAWDVTYERHADGLIKYDSKYNSERAAKASSMVISVIVAGLSAYLGQSIGYAPFPSPAF